MWIDSVVGDRFLEWFVVITYITFLCVIVWRVLFTR